MVHFVTTNDRGFPGTAGVSGLFSEMERLLREHDAAASEVAGARPRIFARYGATGYELDVELPGIQQDEVQLDVRRGVLTISGERKLEVPEGFRGIRRERAPFRFSRSVQLPEDVASDAVQASMRDGLLTIRLPKSATSEPKRIQIASH
jgi:HSP20 family protein